MTTHPLPTDTGAGVEISLRIGQRVRHSDHLGQRVTGVVRGLSIDSDRALQVDIVLDAPIVIPASSAGREISIWHQHVPAHELAPFDDRDELIAEFLAALEGFVNEFGECGLTENARAAIAKATGGTK